MLSKFHEAEFLFSAAVRGSCHARISRHCRLHGSNPGRLICHFYIVFYSLRNHNYSLAVGNSVFDSSRPTLDTSAMTDALREKLQNLPDKPGCYLFRGRTGRIIYVGKAVSLRKRVQSYFRSYTLRHAPPKLRSLIHSVVDLDILVVRNEDEALLTESSLIKQHRPRYNILMRDDKRYLAIRGDPRDPVPRFATCRIVREDGARYFGPFPSDTVVRVTLDFIERRYGIRKCPPLVPDAETHAHCINDIVRFCSAPCVGRVSPEEYHARFTEACAFLSGERVQVLAEVEEQMRAAAASRKASRSRCAL